MVLSIILTVYNKESFLKRAFDSILSQIGSNDCDYEVIVVNDGSTDGSKLIIENYCRDNSLIRVITQSNQGLSMARNNGVAYAIGDYVWFVDADDIIAPDSVSLIIDATKTHPDIIPIYAETKGVLGVRNKIPTNAKTGRDILLSKSWNHCGPFYIYKRSFLNDNNLHYIPGIYHEDSELTPRLLFFAKTVVVIPKVLYSVIRDPNSITQIPRKKRAYDYIIVAENLYNFSRQFISNDDLLLRCVYDSVISVVINNALSIICVYDYNDQINFNNLLFNKKFLFQSLKGASSFKYKIESLLFKLFPRHCVNIYKIMKSIW